MPVITITNCGIFNGRRLERVPKFSFQGSPGDIVSSEMASDISIDGTNHILIPGLIDAKTDIDTDPSAFKVFASLGVTTIIDDSSASSETQPMRDVAANDPTCPSYLATGSAVGPYQSDISNLFPYRGIQAAMTPFEAESMVTQRVTEGSDFIKIIVDQPGLNIETLTAAVACAQHHGKKVIAHASQLQSCRIAVGLGVDCITPVPMDNPLDGDTIRSMVQKGIGVVPTLCFLRRGIHGEMQHPDSPSHSFSSARDAVKALYEAGVKICAGTASNNVPGMAVPLGHGLFEELRELREAGMSNVDVIRAATSVPAEVFGLHDRGVIAIGRRADLVLVEGDSFDDVLLDGRIRKVWIRGVEI